MPPVTHKQAQALVKRYDRLKAARSTHEGIWQKVLELVNPPKATVTREQQPGALDMSNIYDSTQITANEYLAGNMHGLLTNPDGNWFEIITANEGAMRTWSIGVWLEVVVELIRRFIRDSNFDTQMSETYMDEVAIGNALLFLAAGPGAGAYGNGLRFQSMTVAECVMAENEDGIVDTVIRSFPWTVRQAALKFGEERLSGAHRKALAKDPDQIVRFLHAIYPRKDVVKDAWDRLNKPWASVYIDPEAEMAVFEGGFDEWPFGISRWTKLSGEIYGRGPGMMALPDIQMLQRMMRTTLRAGEKAVDPSLFLPDDGVLVPVVLGAGTINYFDAARPELEIRQLPTGHPDWGMEIINDVRNRIRSIYLVDLFDLKESPQMTATEAQIRDERQRRALAPVAGRHKVENLHPMIVRAFGILWRQGRIPPPPPELVREPLMVQYTTPIARSQRMVEAEGMARLMGTMGPLMELSPQSADNFNWDYLARYASELFTLPKQSLRSEESVAMIRQQRQAMIEAEQKMEMIRRAGEAAEQAGKAGVAAGQAKQIEMKNQPQNEAI